MSYSKEKFYNLLFSYSDNYIRNEVDFFKTYGGDQSEIIINELEHLLQINTKETPLIRLGLGSGFHAMTGDTLHPDHKINGIGNRNRGLSDGYDSSKSRKLAFIGSDENLQLYPMGFVQLMTEDYYEQYYKKEFEDKKQKIEIAKIAEIAKVEQDQKAIETQLLALKKSEEEKIEKERIAAEEAKKPKTTEMSSLSNKKSKPVDAIVTGQDGLMLLFKPYVSGLENTVFKIRYPGGMPIDTIIQIECTSNGKTIIPTGSPKIK